MAGINWKPWHKVVQVRDDLKSGELSLNLFAANLYDVANQRTDAIGGIYVTPTEFFALTYPTFNMRDLARDIALRLAGRSDKAVRQLALTYGGGKTHTLITLFHLFNNPQSLPTHLPAVDEFIKHMDMTPPRARVSVLTFDYLDPEQGMEVLAPDGAARRLKYPWSVLAFQLAGEAGLKILSPEAGERETPPFTNVLEELLRLPAKEGLATLVLMDEVLMWARTKAGYNQIWLERVQDFFQCLVQAAGNVKTCAVVISLLASDLRKNDEEGKRIANELTAVLRRQQEESIQPVLKEDVAEVLRRRLLTADSIRDREAFRPHVVAALKGIAELDEQTKKDGKAAEDRYMRSFPFHPDLTEIFYNKWTNLDNFQRTRGVLRTYALALREAEKWDHAPLISTNTFLSAPDKPELSEATRDLADIATRSNQDGAQQSWSNILEGELLKARQVQQENGGLQHREVEQAVLAAFLHSQPIGMNSKALTRELMVLVGHTRPDRINLEQNLLRWAEISWFLDEESLPSTPLEIGAARQLPKTWRLGLKPNLTQMHAAACDGVQPDIAAERLLTEIAKVKSLIAGVSAAGATPHLLPKRPNDIEDDGAFHFAILPPSAASEANRPSSEARRMLEETTGSDRPRVNKNSVILVAPSSAALDIANNRVREALGWDEVYGQIKELNLDPIRTEKLVSNRNAAWGRVPDAIKQAYSIVIALSEKGDVQAFKVAVDEKRSIFETIKADSRARIQDKAISAEALMPEGPYNLWRPNETSRRVKNLVEAFSQFAHLPKMLNPAAIYETLAQGCKAGIFVLRQTRPDRSIKTYWRQQPDDTVMREASLELVLPEAAELTELASGLLLPDTLPKLWEQEGLSFKQLSDYFRGGHVVKVQAQGYEEPVMIPKVERASLEEAVQAAVRAGRLWLINGPASILAEEIPVGVLTAEAVLQPPPAPIPATDVIKNTLPEAWQGEITTALAISSALSQRAGKTLPWYVVREAIDGALRSRWLEQTIDSGSWPCPFTGAQAVKLKMASHSSMATVTVSPAIKEGTTTRADILTTEAELQTSEIQNLADNIGELKKAAVGAEILFTLKIQLRESGKLSKEARAKIDELLAEIATGLKLQ